MREGGSPTELLWTQMPVTSTGPTWAIPAPMTVPSSARTLTGATPATSFRTAAHSLPNNCNSIKTTASFTGRIAKKWCVGIALDVEGGKVYWTQKGPEKGGQGRIFRANLEIPAGQTPQNRQDIEVLYTNLPEPIDLDLDLANRIMYWTDRGDPPRGNTVNRAPMDAANGNRPVPEIVFNHLMEGIGLALDLDNGRMFVTDLAGSVYSANLDGSNKKPLIFAQGNLTGIAYAELPASS